jgi:hypothetical protein
VIEAAAVVLDVVVVVFAARDLGLLGYDDDDDDDRCVVLLHPRRRSLCQAPFQAAPTHLLPSLSLLL